MKLCNRLLMVFCRNLCEKTSNLSIWTHFGEVRVDARHWLMARQKAHSQLSLDDNSTFFTIYYGSRVMRRNVYSAAVFTGGRPLYTHILPGQGHPPAKILGIRKLKTLGYLAMKTAFLYIPLFWHNTGVWRIDRRTCRSIYSACKASFAEHCNKP